jgi:hypothetical protein
MTMTLLAMAPELLAMARHLTIQRFGWQVMT